MATAIVPVQVTHRQVRADAFIQDAFEIRLDIFVIGSGLSPIEERGGRQLFRVTYHDHLLSSGHCPNRIPNRNLRSLIEDDQVERSRSRRQVLGDRKRAH
ncbi:hypothetical protein D3C81_1801440 [compost metagenome]